MSHGGTIEAADPMGVVPVDTHDTAGQKARAHHGIAASYFGEEIATPGTQLSLPKPRR